jgi:hypothetical protein
VESVALFLTRFAKPHFLFDVRDARQRNPQLFCHFGARFSVAHHFLQLLLHLWGDLGAAAAGLGVVRWGGSGGVARRAAAAGRSAVGGSADGGDEAVGVGEAELLGELGELAVNFVLKPGDFGLGGGELLELLGYHMVRRLYRMVNGPARVFGAAKA